MALSFVTVKDFFAAQKKMRSAIVGDEHQGVVTLREEDGSDVALASKVGALTETAPATDTASSGLNGRLQRLAQHLTNVLAGMAATAAAVPTRAFYLGVNIAGNLTGWTGFSVGSHRAASVAVVDASGNQVTAFGGTAAAVLTHHLITAASANAANIKASAGVVWGVQVFNNATYPIYVKLHNTAGTPTAGVGVVYTVGVQAGQHRDCVIPAGGRSFATGIGITVVKDLADAGTTAVLASDASIEVSYV